MYSAYAIGNTNTRKIYIGQTEDINARLLRHNGKLPNKKKSYTRKNKGMWILIHKEDFNARKEAIKREKELKSYQGRKFIRDKFKK